MGHKGQRWKLGTSGEGTDDWLSQSDENRANLPLVRAALGGSCSRLSGSLSLFSCIAMEHRDLCKRPQPSSTSCLSENKSLADCPGSVSIVVIKYIDKEQLRKKWVILAYNSKIQSVIIWGKSRQNLEKLVTPHPQLRVEE